MTGAAGKAVAVVALWLAGPAMAETCFGPGHLPRKVRFDNGNLVTILARQGEDVTYSSPLPDGRLTVTQARAALFPLRMTLPDGDTTYAWKTALPKGADLKVGLRYDETAVMSYADGRRESYRVRGAVLRDAVVTLGGCRYPARVFASTISIDGKDTAKVTVYLNLDLAVAFQTEGKVLVAGGTDFTYRAVGLE